QLKTALFHKQKAISDQEHEIRLGIAEYVAEIYHKFGSFTYNFEELYFVTKLYSQIEELQRFVSPILLKYYVYEWLDNKEENTTISDLYYALESLKILEEEVKEVEVSFVLNKALGYRIKKELIDPEKVAKLSNNDIYKRLVILEEEDANNIDIIDYELRLIILERQDETGGFSDWANTYRKDEGSIEATYWAIQILKKLPATENPRKDSFFERLVKTFYQLLIFPLNSDIRGEEKIPSHAKVPRLLGKNTIQKKEKLIVEKIPSKIMATAPAITGVYLNGSSVTEGETIDVNQSDLFTVEISSSDDITASCNLSVSLDIQIPLDEIEIAIFNTTWSYWLNPSTQANIAATIINNVPAKNITCYNYNEQNQLINWMESKLDDKFPDVLILMDYVPYDIWKGEREDSLIECWLEKGNGLIFTGYRPFRSALYSTGGSTSYGDEMQFIFDSTGDRRDRFGDEYYDQYLALDGWRYLPSMGSSLGQYLYYSYGVTHYKAINPLNDPWKWAARFSKYANGRVSRYDNYVLEHNSGGSFAQFYTDSTNTHPRGEVISEYLNNWYTINILSKIRIQTHTFGDMAIFNTSHNSGWISLSDEQGITDSLINSYYGNVEIYDYTQQINLQQWLQNRLTDDRNDLLVVLDYSPQILFSGSDNSLAEQWLEAGNSILWTGERPFYYYIDTSGNIFGSYSTGLTGVLDGTGENLAARNSEQMFATSLGVEYLPSLATEVGEGLHVGYGGLVNTFGIEWGFRYEFTHAQFYAGRRTVSDSYALKHKDGGIWAQFYIQSGSLPRSSVLREFIKNWPYISNHFINESKIETNHGYFGSEYNVVNITLARNLRFHFDILDLGSGDNVSFFDATGTLLYVILDSATDFWTP
ncbi:MAG: hypothetical protein ACFFDT_39165, partial [Candidatus Hodarchaeota archaeon]